MGMDVSGLRPSDPVGKYFRASIWEWRVIHRLCAELCFDLLDRETLEAMCFNECLGPGDQSTCTQMAIRFDRWMEHHASGHSLESNLRVDQDGHFVSKEELAANPDLETETPFQVSDQQMKQ